MRAAFVADCACAPGTFMQADSDGEAAFWLWEFWRQRLQAGPLATKVALYFSVHGPSGHALALHDSPVGRLPAPPPTCAT